jgi:predicted naringenin-chalcone synthase
MYIRRIATALPKNGFSTDELLKSFPCSLPEGVRQNVLNLGVMKRYLVNQTDSSFGDEMILSEHAVVDLCCDACFKALEKEALSINDIDYFVATYDANPFLSPGLSQILFPKLGLKPYVKHVNAQGVASTAFPKALDIAENYLAAHPEGKALLCISGVSSTWFQNQVHGIRKVMDIKEINQIRNEAQKRFELRKWVAVMEYFLFGDGVAAAVVSRSKGDLSVEKNVEVTNLEVNDYLAGYSRLAAVEEPFRFGFYSHLDKDIPKLGGKYTSLALDNLLEADAQKRIRTAKKWAVHTGSEKILNMLAERHEIGPDRFEESHCVLRECGNLAGASLPFILERILSGDSLSTGDTILMVGYGWGFSAAACLLKKT